METTYRPFFVYGTLRPGETNNEAILGSHVEETAPAILHGYRLLLTPSYPMAVPTKDQGSQILGEIIYVARENFESILEDMDELEGYWGEGSSENLYTRVIARPALANGPRAGKEVETYLYVATQNALEQNASYTCPSSTGDWTKREQDFSE